MKLICLYLPSVSLLNKTHRLNPKIDLLLCLLLFLSNSLSKCFIKCLKHAQV